MPRPEARIALASLSITAILNGSLPTVISFLELVSRPLTAKLCFATMVVSVLFGSVRLFADSSPLFLETLVGRKPAHGTTIIADKDGHFFVADYFYNQVCLYTLKSGTHVIAGSGVAGFRDGAGSASGSVAPGDRAFHVAATLNAARRF